MRCIYLVSAIVLYAITSDLLAADFNGRYVALTGDFNADSKTDIYLVYRPGIVFVDVGDIPVPIATSRREVGDFLLQQNSSGGGFSIVSGLSSSQIASLRQWPESNITTVVGDLNFDGYTDLYLQGVPGEIGALESIVYAPATNGTVPTVKRDIDSSFSKFVTDIDGWDSDPANYFEDAWLPVIYYVPWWVNVYDCGSAFPEHFWDGSGQDVWASFECDWLFSYVDDLPIPGEEFDYANFSAAAYNVAVALDAYVNETGDFEVDVADANLVWQQIEYITGVSFITAAPTADVWVRPSVGPSAGAWSGILRWLGHIGKIGSWIGGILHSTDTAHDDTLFDLFDHYSYAHLAFHFTEGMKLNRDGEWFGTRYRRMTGLEAQDLLALPPHDAYDNPPDGLYIVYVDKGIPRQNPIETEVAEENWLNKWTQQINHRDGGGTETRFYQRTGFGSVSGPWPVIPEP